MHAAVLHRFGGPEGVVYDTWPEPVIADGEVMVDIAAAALNRRDWWIRRNARRGPAPLVLGSDACGRVRGDDRDVVVYPARGWGQREAAAGPDFEILGVPRQGTHAERISVDEAMVFGKPARLSQLEASTLGVAGLTAWRALTRRGGVDSASTVLVTGASAGTGVFAVQIASALGARVLVTTSSEAKLARLVELGADGGADWRRPDWPQRIRSLASGGVDVAIDSAGGASWAGIVDVLRPGGTLVSFGDTAGDQVQIGIAPVFFGHLSIHGTTLGSPREFQAFLDHVETAVWRPVIDSVFPLEACREAHERLDHPDRFGKVVLTCA